MASFRFQFRLRHYQLVIALFGIALGYGQAKVRWAEYHRRADIHARFEGECLEAMRYSGFSFQFDSAPGWTDPEQPPLQVGTPKIPKLNELRVMSDYHERMRRHWEGQW